MITIEQVDSNTIQEYTDFVHVCPESHLNHSQEWMKVLESSFSWRPKYLLARNNGVIEGVLPLFLISLPIMGRKLFSLPMSLAHSRALLALSEEVKNALVQELIKLGKELKASLIEIRTNHLDAAFQHQGFLESTPFIYPVVSLFDLETNKHMMSKGHKAAINFATKNRVEVRTSTSKEDLQKFYAILQDSYHSFGTPLFSRTYLENMMLHLKKESGSHLLCVEKDDEMIGGGLFLRYKSTFMYKYGACKKDTLYLRPFQALVWRGIELGLELGCNSLDLGASTADNDGLLLFKKHFGAELNNGYHYVYGKGSARHNSISYAQRYKLPIAMWKRLSRWVVDQLGPAVVSWMA